MGSPESLKRRGLARLGNPVESLEGIDQGRLEAFQADRPCLGQEVLQEVDIVVELVIEEPIEVGGLSPLGYGAGGATFEQDHRPAFRQKIAPAGEHNFLSAVRFAREVVPYMKQQRWGRIIHLLPTQVKQVPEGAALSLSGQLALVGYSKMLANELASSNITVNNVLTGPVKTEFFTETLEAQAEEQGRSLDDLLKETSAGLPMKRLRKPEEVADLVAFLASERAGYLTGTSVVIDGGRLQTLN